MKRESYEVAAIFIRYEYTSYRVCGTWPWDITYETNEAFVIVFVLIH